MSVDLIALSLTLHMLPFAVLSLLSGTVSDQYHRPTLLRYGLLLSTIGSTVGAFAPNIYVFFLSRVIQGVGSAFIMPITMALLGDITPDPVIGKAMGVYGVFIGLATTLGPLVGGRLALIQWRYVPTLLASYSFILTLLVNRVFPGPVVTAQSPGLIRHTVRQFRQAVRNRDVLLASLAGFLLFFTFQGIQPIIADLLSLPPLIIDEEGIGVLFAVVGLVGILFSYLGGIVISRLGSRRTMVMGFFMMLAPQALLLWADSYWRYVGLFSLLGGFQRITLTATQTLTIEALPRERGSASSLFNFSRYLGFAFAPTGMVTLYLAHGITSLYGVNLVLLALGGLAAMLTPGT